MPEAGGRLPETGRDRPIQQCSAGEPHESRVATRVQERDHDANHFRFNCCDAPAHGGVWRKLPEPKQRMADTESAARSAREVGSDMQPNARLQVKLADEQLAAAKPLVAAGDMQRADHGADARSGRRRARTRARPREQASIEVQKAVEKVKAHAQQQYEGGDAVKTLQALCLLAIAGTAFGCSVAVAPSSSTRARSTIAPPPAPPRRSTRPISTRRRPRWTWPRSRSPTTAIRRRPGTSATRLAAGSRLPRPAPAPCSSWRRGEQTTANMHANTATDLQNTSSALAPDGRAAEDGGAAPPGRREARCGRAGSPRGVRVGQAEPREIRDCSGCGAPSSRAGRPPARRDRRSSTTSRRRSPTRTPTPRWWSKATPTRQGIGQPIRTCGRRAKAVRDYLVTQGIAAESASTASLADPADRREHVPGRRPRQQPPRRDRRQHPEVTRWPGAAPAAPFGSRR